MTRCEFYTEEDRITGFSISGHSGYAENGQDIVCAAISTAVIMAEAVINEAKAYQNAQLPQAEATADQLIQNAEYLKQKRINEAKEQVAMFTAMYEQYSINPEITRSRMYYEAISQILPDVKLFVNTSGGEDVQMLLPLDSLLGNPTAEQP